MPWETISLCVLIFFCRVLDVTLGTIRMITTVKGNKAIATFFGFVEVLIWFTIVRKALNSDDTSIFIAISYAGGYATGTLVGSIIAQALVKTTTLVQVITSSRDESLLLCLREAGYAFTVMDVYGSDHKASKFMLYIELDSKKVNRLNKLILEHDAKAFITVSEVKKRVNGYFSSKNK